MLNMELLTKSEEIPAFHKSTFDSVEGREQNGNKWIQNTPEDSPITPDKVIKNTIGGETDGTVSGVNKYVSNFQKQ